MSVEQASIFLAGAILTCAGFSIIAIAIVFINNLFAKYWKSFTFGIFPASGRFITEEEATRISPSFDETKNQK